MPSNPNENIDYSSSKLQTIYLAGGCFWGTQAYMRRIKGVSNTMCGYANGTLENPTYKQVCSGDTGHAETVLVKFDPEIISLERLLKEFYDTIDPTIKNRQGGDIGTQYRTGIYYTNISHKETIEKSVQELQQKYIKPIVMETVPLINFYNAEEYHQDYLENNPGGYCHVDLTKLNNK